MAAGGGFSEQSREVRKKLGELSIRAWLGNPDRPMEFTDEMVREYLRDIIQTRDELLLTPEYAGHENVEIGPTRGVSGDGGSKGTLLANAPRYLQFALNTHFDHLDDEYDRTMILSYFEITIHNLNQYLES
jgi:hypothetical protein